MLSDEILRPDHAPTAKNVVSWLAAGLGIGSFLGLVNLAVGVLSATWLTVQIYGYLTHELPAKRLRRQILRRELDRLHTRPGDLGRMEADE